MKVIWTLALVLLLSAGGAAIWFLTRSETSVRSDREVSAVPESPVIEDVPALPLPQVSSSPWLNTAPDVKSVGTAKCVECHGDAHRSFLLTRHSQSMSAAGSEDLPDAVIDHPLSGYHYATTCVDGTLLQSETAVISGAQTETRDVKIDFVMGSGHFGKSFLTKLDGFLIQSPLTWYSPRKEWGLSPGFDMAGQSSFRRAVSARCLYCHAGHVESIGNNAFRMNVHEMSVTCERCHGPGERHVEARESLTAALSDAEPDLTIVNPGHLSRELSEAVCQQCHLQGKAQVEIRGRQFDSFRPGLPLQDFRIDYQIRQSEDMTIVGHVEQMHLSECYRQSETLTCITCHSPHPAADALPPEAKYRKTCLECHAEDACREDHAARDAAGDSCVACHMPSAATEVPHVAFTHHRIGIHTSAEGGEVNSSDAPAQLIAFLPNTSLSEADQRRNEGLAWLNLYLTLPDLNHEKAMRSAQEALDDAWRMGAGDAEVAAGLATIAHDIGWNDMVEVWATRAIAMDASPSDARLSALAQLSELQFNQQKFAAAYDGFRELTEARRDARYWFFRGVTAQNLDRTDEAIEALQKSVDINPKNHAGHVALSALYRLTGDTEQEARHSNIATALLREAGGR
ncbi:MAG: cytochrome c3 family protein [Planctomycetaceae bacterium]